MKETFIDRKFSNDSLGLIDIANQIIFEYQTHSLTLTLRQLYYQFVARDHIPNTVQSYKRLWVQPYRTGRLFRQRQRSIMAAGACGDPNEKGGIKHMKSIIFIVIGIIFIGIGVYLDSKNKDNSIYKEIKYTQDSYGLTKGTGWLQNNKEQEFEIIGISIKEHGRVCSIPEEQNSSYDLINPGPQMSAEDGWTLEDNLKLGQAQPEGPIK